MRKVDGRPDRRRQTLPSKAGCRAGEIVVTDGVDKLQPGAKVAARAVSERHGGERTGGSAGDRETKPPGSSERRRSRPAAAMSPSRPFILRPVATSLLMVAHPARRHRRLSPAAGFGLPQVDYPTIQVMTFYPGASPDVMASSVTAPLERQFGQVPGLHADDVEQLRRRLGDHAAVRPRARTSTWPSRRCRRPSTPPDVSAQRSAQPADLQQDQSGRRADPDAGADVEDAAAVEGGGPRRHAAGAEDLAAARRRPGQHQRRPEAGGPHPGQPDGALARTG